MYCVCPNRRLGLYFVLVIFDLASIKARLLLHSCIRFEYFIHESHIGNPYKWLPLTSVSALFSLPHTVTSARRCPLLLQGTYLKLPSMLFLTPFCFKEPEDVARRYSDLASKQDPASIRTYTVHAQGEPPLGSESCQRFALMLSAT